MIHYRPHVAASTRIAKRDPRPKAEPHHLRPNFDPIAYAAVLEVLG